LVLCLTARSWPWGVVSVQCPVLLYEVQFPVPKVHLYRYIRQTILLRGEGYSLSLQSHRLFHGNHQLNKLIFGLIWIYLAMTAIIFAVIRRAAIRPIPGHPVVKD